MKHLCAWGPMEPVRGAEGEEALLAGPVSPRGGGMPHSQEI